MSISPAYMAAEKDKRRRSKTKAEYLRVAADGHEWRRTTKGEDDILWHFPYLENGRPGKSTYSASYGPKTIEQLQKQYGARNPARPRRVDRGRSTNTSAGERNASLR